uniref:Reverse transcriptase zinc-binding domain-containing protein n=1 Tax=Fagus sylvatica TaxID=28930 RepID=A0A2N9H162_FAGSY
MEALSRLLERVTEGGFITGYSVGNSDSHALSISHLLFADDTLIMCGATPDQLWHLRGVFIWFQAVSGLKINMGKSELVPIGQAVWNKVLECIEKRLAACRIEKLHRDFLWGGLGDEHKYHLVNWKHICDSIRYGGLGIRNVVGFNKALLGKWLWRYAMEREALWLKVIDAKYGSIFISYSVGDGSRIKFWHDQRHLSGSMQLWDIDFLRSVQDWELELMTTFMDLLYSIPVSRVSADSICWQPTSRKEFEVKSFYQVLHPPTRPLFPWRSVWKSRVPSKVAFFVWTAVLGKILHYR